MACPECGELMSYQMGVSYLCTTCKVRLADPRGSDSRMAGAQLYFGKINWDYELKTLIRHDKKTRSQTELDR